MPLDPRVVDYLRGLADTSTAQAAPLSLAEQRLQATHASLALAGVPEPVAACEDRTIPGPAGALPIRLYTPLHAGTGPLPALVYFHGGGWVFGSIEGHDPVCRALANRAHCLVISVGYRLAPEDPFPAAPEDCYAATNWVAEHGREIKADPTRLAVGGDSSGGNLAAAVALMVRDRGGPQLCHQVIIYGETAYPEPGTASYATYAEGYGLSRTDMLWYWDQYLGRSRDRTHPYATPLHVPDLSGLAPALIITAEYDPVRDEAEQYAQRLREAGVPVYLSRYNGMIHGFFRMFTLFRESHQALEEIAGALALAWA